MNLAAKCTLSLFFSLLLCSFSFAQAPANDNCGSPATLTPVLSCTTPVSSSLYLATVGTPASTCGTAYDVWYAMATPSNVASVTIDVQATGQSVSSANTFFAVYAGSACAPTLVTGTSCTPAGTSLVLENLSPSTTYYVRVFTSTNPSGGGASSAKFAYTICATYTTPPANDDCAAATALTIGAGTSGTVWRASASTGVPAACAGTANDDVWYKFTATNSTSLIALSNVGADLSSNRAVLQLFSGSCGSLTSIACSGNGSIYLTNLTPSVTYYVRVYSYGNSTTGTASSGSAFTITVSNPTSLSSLTGTGGRLNEVFRQTVVSPANGLADPWEIIYGPDGYLWITEARGYKVYRMDPSNGMKVTVLDVSQNSNFLPAADRGFNVQFSSSSLNNIKAGLWPQGGFAGMVLHPKFFDAATPKNYVYVSYVHSYDKMLTAPTDNGIFFINRVVRFTYNTTTGMLESPVSLCDTLPGSSDHNSQRMIIAPVGGTDYLFYAAGDMGAGQYDNTYRNNNAQVTGAYEGKILRFNLEDDGDSSTLDKWIPNDNPFNSGSVQSAVWSTGIRNNQGFAYTTINGTGYLYGSSHGPFSDDEVNIIERAKNYGHPIVIGLNDGNYDGAKAGPSAGKLPTITSEETNVNSVIGTANYRDPIYSFYPIPKGNTTTTGTVQYIYNQVNTGNGNNAGWPSEAPSGMDIYTGTAIPGWRNSLLLGALKGGKLIRLKLKATGLGIDSTNGNDSVSYFRSVNRFRDLALTPDGKTVYVVIDKSQATSGPSTANPIASACAGCVIKYTFLGYNTVNSRSNLPTSINVSPGTANSCTTGTTTTIDNTNNTLWVPITGPDGNIVAEINANGNNLGTVTSSFYINGGSVRQNASKRLYADRNITITPQTQPSTPVTVRLYLTAAELASLKTAVNTSGFSSGVNTINDVAIYKNSDACGSSLTSATTTIVPTIREAFGSNYVLQADIPSFSSFYFANPSMVLPLQLIDFKGSIQSNAAHLKWETANEFNSAHFMVERSIDGQAFTAIGKVAAAGNSGENRFYNYVDADVLNQPAPVIYYRLKIVDKDGSFTYSRVISFPINSNTLVTIYPNPVKQTLNVKINSPFFPYTVQVSDLSGRIVYTDRKMSSSAELDVRSWTPQVYLLKVFNNRNELIATQKFEKVQ